MQTIQNSALRISCGAGGKTNCNALLVECGELPISIRLKQRTAIYAVKTKIIPRHPSRNIYFPDTNNRFRWIRTNLSKRKPHTAPFIIKNYISDQRIQDLTELLPSTFHTPPWKLFLPHFDTTLLGIQKENPGTLPMSLETISKYDTYIKIYTDASKINNKTGIGIYIPSKNCRLSQRTTDDISIFAAELTAIKIALQWSVQQRPEGNIAIFTDSLSSLQAISNHVNSSSKPYIQDTLQLVTTLNASGRTCTIIWIPSHIGIIGNETAYKLAIYLNKRHILATGESDSKN